MDDKIRVHKFNELVHYIDKMIEDLREETRTGPSDYCEGAYDTCLNIQRIILKNK